MASIANAVSNLTANYKSKWKNKIINTVPRAAILQQYDAEARPNASVKVKWADVSKQGRDFIFPTKVQDGQGFTYLGDTYAEATLEDALNIQLVEAKIKGFEVNNRQRTTFGAAYTGDSVDEKVVQNVAQLILENLKDVTYSRLEMSALFGRSGYGIVDGTPTTADAYVTLDVVISAATFAPGWWVGQQGARVEFFNGTTIRGTSLYGTVNTVNVSTRSINFTISGSGANTVASGDGLFMKGSLVSGGTYKEMPGLYMQLSDASSTLFDVNRANYSLMQGSTFAVGGRLTKAKVIQAAMGPVNKGNLKNMVLLVGTATWADLSAEDMAQRMFDGSYSSRKSESGSEEIVYTNVNGQIRVVCHPYMKAGVAILFSEEDVSWVGATDVTFKLPDGKDLFYIVPDKNSYETQSLAIKCIYHEAPGRGTVLTGIVNAS